MEIKCDCCKYPEPIYNFFRKIDIEKFKNMMNFAKAAKEYSERKECDDPEEWMIDLFEFCSDFVEMFAKRTVKP